jgi:hypothetical protein
MNERQRIGWIVVAALGVACLLFPPFAGSHPFVTVYKAHAPLWSPPSGYDKIHVALLAIELLIVGLGGVVAHLGLGHQPWVSLVAGAIAKAWPVARTGRGSGALRAAAPAVEPYMRTGVAGRPVRLGAAAGEGSRAAADVEAACPHCRQRVVLRQADPAARLEVNCPRCRRSWLHEPRPSEPA